MRLPPVTDTGVVSPWAIALLASSKPGERCTECWPTAKLGRLPVTLWLVSPQATTSTDNKLSLTEYL